MNPVATVVRGPALRTPRQIETRLVMVALSALLGGALFYFFLRDPTRVILFAPLADWLDVFPGEKLPGTPVYHMGALPSLLHTLGFSLLLAAAASTQRQQRCVAVYVWCSVAVLLEFLQWPRIAAALTEDAEHLPSWLWHYLAHGTFDAIDLCAVAIAGLLAHFLIIRLQPEGKPT